MGIETIVTTEEEGIYQSLALNRKEIPIISLDPWSNLHPDFVVPIHRLVLELPAKVRFGQQYAEKVFDQVWGWTGEDVNQFISDPVNNIGEGERRYLEGMVAKGGEHWGFKHFSSRSQNFLLSAECQGFGTIVFPGHHHHLQPVRVPSQVNFSREKASAYSAIDSRVIEGRRELSFHAPLFVPQNVDNIIQAFLLRNWSIVYQNLLLRIGLGLET